MREHIAKGLKRRSATVEAAVKKYNDAAKRVVPPRARINTKTVLDYAAVGEFDFLRQSRHNITEKPWSRQAEREAMTMYFKLQRSREEIRRLNIEITRHYRYMQSHETQISNITATLDAENPAMAYQMRKRHILRGQADNVHRSRICAIEKLTGYTGKHLSDTSNQSYSVSGRDDRSNAKRMSEGVEKGEHGDIEDEVDSDEEYSMFDDFVTAISSITLD